MKSYKMLSFAFLLSVFLLTGFSVLADSLFDGGGYGANYGNSNTNVPMPANPSPPPSSYSNDSSQSKPAYSKPSTKSSSGSLLTPQMRDDIVDSVYNQWVQQQKQAKLNAIKAQKEAEIKKQQDEAKKKKEAQNWLKNYQANTSPQINNVNATVKFLEDSDPVGLKINNGLVVPSPADNLEQIIPVINKSAVKKQEEASTTPVKNEPDPYAVKMSEGEMREMYYGSDREIMQCANGSKECSPDYVKALQIKRLTAEQGLTIHYDYKEVNGNFIKKPN